MPKSKQLKGNKAIKAVEEVKVPLSHLQALEAQVAEEKLREKLYREVLNQASELLGIDILKKVGSQRSGP